jgi:hypothetical protein
MIDFLVYLGSGKLLLFFARKFPPIQRLTYNRELLSELYNCDLCSGFWLYLVLAPFFKINMNIENKILRWIVTACLSSLMMVLIKTGWEDLFGTLVIENAPTGITGKS